MLRCGRLATMQRADQLWARALRVGPRSPDPEGHWTVLADWLQHHDDPRGALMSLQIAREQRSASPAALLAERRVLFEHRHRFLGPLARRAKQVWHGWRRGHLVTLELTPDPWTTETAEIIAQLSEDGGLALLDDLRLCSSVNFDNVLSEMATHDWPWLRRLRLGPLTVGAGRTDAPLEPLLGRMPRLEVLRLELPSDIGGIRHPKLRSLTMHALPDRIRLLNREALPSLVSLSLFTRDPCRSEDLALLADWPLEELELGGGAFEGWWTLHRQGRVPVPDRLVLHGSSALRAAERAGVPAVAGRRRSPITDRLLVPRAWARWRRFVRGDRFWSIRREGSRIVLQYGALGKKGRRREQSHHDAYAASRAYIERLEKKLKDGYEEAWLEDPTAP